MTATMTEIAREAGVSLPIVSRLLRGDPSLRISEDRRRKIIEIKDQLGGVKWPKRQLQSVSPLTKTIVAPINQLFADVPTSSTQFFPKHPIYRGVSEVLKKHGFILHTTFFTAGEEQYLIESLVGKEPKCDGLLLMPGVIQPDMLKLFRTDSLPYRLNFPHIASDMKSEQMGLNCAMVNANQGMSQAITHLYELGHRHIGFLGHSNNFWYPLFIAAMTAHDLSIDQQSNCLIPYGTTIDNRYNWTQGAEDAFIQWLNKRTHTTAMVCAYDRLALGVIDTMRQNGLEPGRDLSVIGSDNLEEHELHADQPEITTIDNPLEFVGHRCGELLLEQIHGKRPYLFNEQIPTKLIVRKTTGPCQST